MIYIKDLRALAKKQGIKGYSKMSKKELINILTNKPPEKEIIKPVEEIKPPEKEIIKPVEEIKPPENKDKIKTVSYTKKKTYNKPLPPPNKKKDIMILKHNLPMDKLIEKKIKLNLPLTEEEKQYINPIEENTEPETTDEETENILINDLLIKLENGEDMTDEEYILIEEYL